MILVIYFGVRNGAKHMLKICENVDWQKDYADALQKGVDTFRVYVEAWYSGDFQNIILTKSSEDTVKSMLCSILSGYVWDESNPYVAQSKRRLNVLAELCAPEKA